MIEWMLIIALNQGYEVQGAYKTQDECQKAGMELMRARNSIGKAAIAGCYKRFAVMVSRP
ncbi:hypothetical protein ALO38_200117 [Pseudomonas coronafaciens pv. zizaniae]|nr:hypothetical protein ALO38_200117 [Pseudomonas coronafaciens pv. zizaniae]